ncbi:AraC family transcriptional regulator [Piscinibacter sp.]|jgi:AraC-like DNA-binding protein|uniref:AraC family transcriptional regulator n=1 Tax=Piscinibacter sp. TaxID=1903157 RepID=UPI002F42A7EA
MADRLTALLQRFELRARVFRAGAFRGVCRGDVASGAGNLYLIRRGPVRVSHPQGRRKVVNEPTLLFYSRPGKQQLDAFEPEGADIVCAAIDFGMGDENPLVRGLPAMLQVPLARMPGLDLTQQLLFDEAVKQRCGHDAAVDRLAEVLVIQLLRYAIEQRLIDGGLLAGLADPRLVRALNAIHADPRLAWTLEAMADVAGMSRARFAARFTRVLGSAPGDYLTGWRLGLARSLLRRGLPVKQVADDVGYGSASAFARAFSQRVGLPPTDWLAAIERSR